MTSFKGHLLLALTMLLLSACASDNEIFCVKYEDLYDELEGGDTPDYAEIKEYLLVDLANPEKDHDEANFMLFVLEDFNVRRKPANESANEYCLRVKRWKHYHKVK